MSKRSVRRYAGIAMLLASLALAYAPLRRWLDERAQLAALATGVGTGAMLVSDPQAGPIVAALRDRWSNDYRALLTTVQERARAGDHSGVGDAISGALSEVDQRERFRLAQAPHAALDRVMLAQLRLVHALHWHPERCARLGGTLRTGELEPRAAALFVDLAQQRLRAMADARDAPVTRPTGPLGPEATQRFLEEAELLRPRPAAQLVLTGRRRANDVDPRAICEARRIFLQAARAMPTADGDHVFLALVI